MSNEHEARGATVALLQQLSIGLSAYRLFPGNLEQASFTGAVERIRAAADRALVFGTMVVEVHGSIFKTETEELPDDETLSRLALACYERRGERLRVRSVPDSGDLAAFYEVLAQVPGDVENAGGPAAILREKSISSIVLGEVEPQAVDIAMSAGLTAEQAEVWERLQHGESLSDLVESGHGGGVGGREAESVFERLRDLLAALPQDLADDPNLYQQLHTSVRSLPEVARKALFNRVVDRAGSDLIAERLLGTMTDTEVVEALADVAEKANKDPVKLAEQLEDRGVRRTDLKGLAVALLGRPAIAGEPQEKVRLTREEREGRERVAGVVSRLLSSKLKALEEQDVQELQKEFPTTDLDFRAGSLATLRDYVGAEEDIERFEKVLDLWAQEVRLALRAAIPDTVEELVEVVRDGGAGGGDDEWAALVRSYGRRVIDASLVDTLRTTAQADGMARARKLLEPLGDDSVDGLLDLLAEERDKVRRVFMISLLSDMATDYRERVVERFEDTRWFVVRNAVTILIRAGVTHEMRSLLERAVGHEHPAVRKEGIQGLTALLGAGYAAGLTRMSADPDQGVRELAVSTLGGLVSPAAVPALGTVARTSEDPSIRRRAIEALGHQALPGARELLAALGSFWHKPRLPRALRHLAKKLAKDLAKGRKK